MTNNKCCKKPEASHCPESFCLHTNKIKPVCGPCIDAVHSDAWGAAQALYDPCMGPFGTVTFVGTAHKLNGPDSLCNEFHQSQVRVKVHFLDCDLSVWCSFNANQCGEDVDDCKAGQGTYVTFKHECIVPSREIAEALACGQVLLSVVTESLYLEGVEGREPCDGDNFGGETGEVRGIVCLQELCATPKYRSVKCNIKHNFDTCVKYTRECEGGKCGGEAKPNHKRDADCGCGGGGGGRRHGGSRWM